IAINQAVTIPAGNPPTYGSATVTAHAVWGGVVGNIAPGAINAVVGSALYLKNLDSFTGGQDAQTTHVVTARDRAHARAEAGQQVKQKQAHTPASGLLTRPCQETEQQTDAQVTVRLTCQYGTYSTPKGVTVLSVEVQGESVVLEVKVAVLPG
ncbi:MAG: hypothetical protein ACRDHW_15365, partial [Ktedonobacteraceae bacterium]